MSRTVEMLGKALMSLFYGVSLAGLVSLLLFVVLPSDTIGSVALGVLVLSLLLAAGVGIWRRRNGTGYDPGTRGDITYDPFADPGQMAKHNWEKAVRRVSTEDDAEDRD